MKPIINFFCVFFFCRQQHLVPGINYFPKSLGFARYPTMHGSSCYYLLGTHTDFAKSITCTTSKILGSLLRTRCVIAKRFHKNTCVCKISQQNADFSKSLASYATLIQPQDCVSLRNFASKHYMDNVSAVSLRNSAVTPSAIDYSCALVALCYKTICKQVRRHRHTSVQYLRYVRTQSRNAHLQAQYIVQCLHPCPNCIMCGHLHLSSLLCHPEGWVPLEGWGPEVPTTMQHFSSTAC